jgi:hypothetical protein
MTTEEYEKLLLADPRHQYHEQANAAVNLEEVLSQRLGREINPWDWDTCPEDLAKAFWDFFNEGENIKLLRYALNNIWWAGKEG